MTMQSKNIKRLFVVSLFFALLTTLGTLQAQATVTNNIIVNASCPSLPARHHPVATVPASYFQWEGGAYYFEQYWIPNQLIISGLATDIDWLTSHPSITGSVSLTQLDSSDLGLFSGAAARDMVLFSSNLDTISTLHIIYNLLDQTTGRAVIAEPNRFTANPWGIGGDPWGIGGDPWGIGGDPWGIGGDPWGIGGDPWGIGGDSLKNQQNGTESRIMPLNQWALRQESGIGLLDGDGNRITRWMGLRSELFVFDSTPYRQEAAYKLYGDHVCNYDASLPVELGAPHDLVKEHGLFAAGLIKKVAPFSEVRLVRALNEAGMGDVFSVVAVMQDVLMAQDQNGALDSSIFNLSLSVMDYPANTNAGQELAAINQRINAISKRLPRSYSQFVAGNDPIPALHQFVTYAEQNGITIVAATGNDSAGTKRQDAALPAAYPATIGVAASNFERNMSCFSNEMTGHSMLMAPGGDGYGKRCDNPFARGDFRSICGNGVNSEYDCPYTIMSATSTGYGQWLGTSFSTPLVAGTAALMLELADNIGCQTSPQLVNAALHDSAQRYGNVLDVAAALNMLERLC